MLTLPLLIAIASIPASAVAIADGRADDCAITYLPGDEPTQGLNTLSSEDDYRRVLRVQGGVSYVKVTIDTSQSPVATYFQNSTIYQYHQNFLSKNVAAYKSMTDAEYSDYLFEPSKKRFSAGAVYYSRCAKAPGLPSPGVLGFNLYFEKVPFNPQEVIAAAKVLRAAIPFAADRVVYLMSPDQRQDWFKYRNLLAQNGVPSFPMELVTAAAQKPTAYHAAKSYGYLRALSQKAFDRGEYTPRDILVLGNVPLDIGPVSGVVTSEPQVPHSHVILRTINQNVPNMYLPQGVNDPKIQKYLDQLVELEVKADGTFTIRGAAEIGADELSRQADTYFASRVPKLPEPQFELFTRDFYSWQTAGSSAPSPALVGTYGAKGTNFAILDRALRDEKKDRSYFEGSFLLPFSLYASHVAQTVTEKNCRKAAEECQDDGFTLCEEPRKSCDAIVAAQGSVQAFLNALTSPASKQAMEQNPTLRKSSLAFARALIEKVDLPKQDLARVRETLEKLHPSSKRIRFRSSTNAEDLPGLNGAGLYDSKGGCLADAEDDKTKAASACMTELEKQRKTKMIETLKKMGEANYADQIKELEKDLNKKRPLSKAIRGLYASMWNEKAYLFREYYRIPHERIFMGALVHPSFVDEKANGVAIATRDEATGETEIRISAQAQDISITNPELPYAVPEHLVVKITQTGTVSAPQYLQRSNLAPTGQSVFTDRELAELARQIQLVRDAMVKAYPDRPSEKYDLEFIIAADSTVLIKQARPLAGI